MVSKPYHHGNLRAELISIALDLLEQEGSAGLDLRKVARQAGVSHAAPYRHFEDKRALLVAVAEEGFVRLLDQMKAASQDDSEIRIIACAQAYVRFALSNPALMREMFSGLTIDRMAFPSLHAASKEAYTYLIVGVESEQAADRIVPGDPQQIALVIWSMIHGIAMLLVENQIPEMPAENADDLTRQHLHVLIEGLRPRE